MRRVAVAVIGLASILVLPSPGLGMPLAPTGRIAVNVQGGSQPTGLYTIDLDSREVVQVLAYSAVFGGGPPSWSPDKTMIAFEMDGIAVINADGTGLTQLTSDPSDRNPAWSPDGTRIAFMSDRVPPSTDLFIMNADGTGITALTNTADQWEAAPDWSPDGSAIAYSASTLTGDTDVWVIDSDGSNPQDLTPGTRNTLQQRPSWSPDGHMIAFDNLVNSTYSIFTMNLDGTGRERRGRGYNPNWSPDGNYLVYAHWEGGPSQLWVVEVATHRQGSISPIHNGNLYSDW
jgi:TolB protein